jgi:hypothetical protein
LQLSDGNREIKQAADNALADFLKEIKEAEVLEFGPMVTILVNQCRSKEKANRYAQMLCPKCGCVLLCADVSAGSVDISVRAELRWTLLTVSLQLILNSLLTRIHIHIRACNNVRPQQRLCDALLPRCVNST